MDAAKSSSTTTTATTHTTIRTQYRTLQHHSSIRPCCIIRRFSSHPPSPTSLRSLSACPASRSLPESHRHTIARMLLVRLPSHDHACLSSSRCLFAFAVLSVGCVASPSTSRPLPTSPSPSRSSYIYLSSSGSFHLIFGHWCVRTSLSPFADRFLPATFATVRFPFLVSLRSLPTSAFPLFRTYCPNIVAFPLRY